MKKVEKKIKKLNKLPLIFVEPCNLEYPPENIIYIYIIYISCIKKIKELNEKKKFYFF
jgi:hypothetical protein